MNGKYKLIVSIAIVSSCAVIGTAFATSATFTSFVTAQDSEVWHHYAGVAATESTYGSKEFWAKGSEGCTTRYFVDPGADCVEHDFSGYDEFATLTYGHELYIPSLFEARNAVYPKDNGDGTVTYGIYPQTNIDDDEHAALVSNLNAYAASHSVEANGWYLYEGVYYTKITDNHYGSDNEDWYYFDNGTKMVSGAQYWFRCEPIVWKKLSTGGGSCLLLSNVLLDRQVYFGSRSDRTIDETTIHANNYKHSSIRSWLNADFYNSAFGLGNGFIQTTVVDNSSSTISEYGNPAPYVCENTSDKVFLLSYKDYHNTSYGFPSSENESDSRKCLPTDFAMSRRGMVYGYSNPNGFYWTRSPYPKYGETVSTIHNDGTSGYLVMTDCDDDRYCVRPAITITPIPICTNPSIHNR